MDDRPATDHDFLRQSDTFNFAINKLIQASNAYIREFTLIEKVCILKQGIILSFIFLTTSSG